jgi:large subunit ribosomal protein L15
VNVGDLENRFDAQAAVSLETLRAAGLCKSGEKLKVLGDGELKKSLKVQAHAFSASAQEKIKKAGGQIEILTTRHKTGGPAQ